MAVWLVAIVVGLAILAGCADVEFGSTFQEDGTASHAVMVTFQRAELDDDQAAILDVRLAEIGEQAVQDGLVVEEIDTADEVGLRLSIPAADPEDAGASLNALINALTLDYTGGPVAPFQGTFEVESGAVGGSAFQLEMTVDGEVLTSVAAALMPEGEELPEGNALDNALQMTYVAVMPGTIRETNGTTVDESTVRWVLPFDRRITLRAESKLGEEGSTTWFVVAAIGGVVAVAALAALVGVLLLRRRRAVAGSARVEQPTMPSADVSLTPQPESLAEAGTTLARAVSRMVSGEQVASVVDQPDEEPRPTTLDSEHAESDGVADTGDEPTLS